MKNALIFGALATALTAMPAMAQTAGQTGTTPRTGQTTSKSATSMSSASADQQFVKKAAAGGLAEVELGNLAKQKASSDQVKQFADRMVTDHSKANDELKSVAEKKNIQLPTQLDAKDKALHDRLSKLSGEQFDRAYMQAMLKDHREDVNEFKKESQSGKDPDVKAFAAKTLPTLQEHLQLAQQDSKAVATSGTKKPGK